MVAGDWYKAFGGTVKTTYYHILKLEDETSVLVDEFDYFPMYKKVVGLGKKKIPLKPWMDRIISGAVHEAPKRTVPFLITL